MNFLFKRKRFFISQKKYPDAWKCSFCKISSWSRKEHSIPSLSQVLFYFMFSTKAKAFYYTIVLFTYLINAKLFMFMILHLGTIRLLSLRMDFFCNPKLQDQVGTHICKVSCHVSAPRDSFRQKGSKLIQLLGFL